MAAIIHLNGYPGTGKLTIAKKLCERENVRLIDNHASANLIFTMARKDGKTAIPENVWESVRKIRKIVTDELPKVALPHLSLVFTNCLSNEDIQDKDIFEDVRSAAYKSGRRYTFINLNCSLEENQRRISNSEREIGMKMTDPGHLAHTYNHYTLMVPKDVNFFALDVTDMTPEIAASYIWKHA